MKDKQTYLTKGSFALLLFVILGYVVKFYPEKLIPFDSSIQTAIRGDLPAILTTIFRGITRLIDLPIVISWAILLTAIFYLKKWKSESLLVAGNLSLAGILIVSLKHLYQRPRPDILHLVEEKGFSFPSGHSLAVTLLIGSLIIIVGQRVKNRTVKLILQISLGIYLVSVIISRVYLGVHYPSDVLASLCLGLGILFIEFPFYDKLRFQWRFTGKQK
ncbi:phosphatase PAP2 family protein [Streptococcus mitis]|uniref:phosphatase PAP2 family protein n=1 Tax=Streptococcus mitis TaxID=28037 RepID=UPI00115ABD33|nr:phosphatase PAP2 family protein [Streptococcus mitis]